MQKKLLVLISAQMQAGKNEFAATLAKELGFYTLAFANPVKEVAIAMLGMPSAVAYGGETERRAWKRYCHDRKNCKNETHDACSDARQWLQWVGTEGGRDAIHPDVWIHRLLERAARSCAPGYVLDDGRFDNELFFAYDSDEKLQELAVFIGANYPNVFEPVRIRVKRPGHENTDTHASEAAQLEIPDDKFEHVIVNDGDLAKLRSEAGRVAKLYVAS